MGLGLRDVLRLDEHDRHAAALCSAGVLAGGNCAVAKLPPKPKGDRYVLEYRGELLCVDVLLMADTSSALASPALGSSGGLPPLHSESWVPNTLIEVEIQDMVVQGILPEKEISRW